MKISNLKTVISKEKEIESEYINITDPSITSKLLEKYKHKGLCSIETLCNKKDQNIVG